LLLLALVLALLKLADKSDRICAAWLPVMDALDKAAATEDVDAIMLECDPENQSTI
jgi:hypothetical protein